MLTKLQLSYRWGIIVEIRHLRYFVAVANELNFTRAAERLNIAQPPLSRQIRQLEDEVGATLIDRDSRPIRLTEAGRLLYEHAQQVLSGFDQLHGVVSQFAEAGRRRFVIGFVGSTLYGLLPEVIRRFRYAIADVDVSVQELTTLEQIAALREGRIDAGFGRLRIDDTAIRRIVLADEPLVAVVPAGHRLATMESLQSLADIMGEPLIVYPRPGRPSYADQVLSILSDLGLQPPKLIEVRELQTAIGLVAAHVGLSIVPESVTRLQRNDVCYLPVPEQTARSPIMLIHRAADSSEELTALIGISCAVHGREPPRGFADRKGIPDPAELA
jgi:DNA-binding transcriptional LysR family regulator